MTITRDSDLPLELRVLAMLRERVPKRRWDPTRITWMVQDYAAAVDVWAVAVACAEWLRDAERVHSGHAELRRHLEREHNRCQTQKPRTLQAYDRSDAVAGRSRRSRKS